MKKLSILLALLLILTFMFIGCDNGGGGEDSGEDDIEIWPDDTYDTFICLQTHDKQGVKYVSVGEEFDVYLRIKSDEAIKSLAIQFSYFEECLELVDFRFLRTSEISDFSDNVAVMAFSEKDSFYSSDQVLALTFKALVPDERARIQILPSIKGVDDKRIDLDLIDYYFAVYTFTE